jgi:gliding motility-associated lipoprotein GldD
MKRLILFGLIPVFILACTHEPSVPKPRTYPRVIFPEKEYILYEHPQCGYTFEIPVYAVVEKDSIFFGKRAPNDCWINIMYPEMNGQLYCSYYPVKNKEDLDRLINDGYKLTSRHTVKAEFINEVPIRNNYGISGRVFEVEGPAASGVQFFLTDSTRHFFNASLYINTEIRPDSLAPVLDFLKPDIDRMITSFRWK